MMSQKKSEGKRKLPNKPENVSKKQLNKVLDRGEYDKVQNWLESMLKEALPKEEAKDFEVLSKGMRHVILGNLTDAEKAKMKIEIDSIFTINAASYPPEGSKMKGYKRMMIYGDAKTPLSKEDRQKRESLKQILYAVISRSGYEREKQTEDTKVVRREDLKDRDKDPYSDKSVSKTKRFLR